MQTDSTKVTVAELSCFSSKACLLFFDCSLQIERIFEIKESSYGTLGPGHAELESTQLRGS